MKLRPHRWTQGQRGAIRKIATLPEYPTIDIVRIFYPNMSDRKMGALLDETRKLRKEISLEINIIPNGIRDSKGFGEIYLIIHPHFDGWVKCGMTNNVKSRLSTYNTCDPLKRFVILKSKIVGDRRQSEKHLIKSLKEHSKECNGEWFKIDSDAAIKIFNNL